MEWNKTRGIAAIEKGAFRSFSTKVTNFTIHVSLFKNEQLKQGFCDIKCWSK